ncbi:pyridoxamine 5'-phosphate oxidase [Microtetraspora sp. NBRC 13810]|uniref:pyridoxamine 5'-phosphate oxidase family protein n=1 Tax=Microtetraspora sp. NBRC 13810 TaxID=3030990 RepID=UPI0025573329|nr:pyridoxamine 5'-phosphate oxidase family protein [Microtetraspora sp. NBRC 13810]GLW08983.1 pyridoxamine 5'-phosphate oxidase [Microtetraspora sp. NBRC 13810]
MIDTTPVAEPLFDEVDATPMSTDEATVKPWSQARACLELAPKMWLSTVRPDGRPHAMPVTPVWVGDAPYFTTRPASRKGRNLIRNPNCVVSVGDESLDLVIEGRATRIYDEDRLRRVAQAFAAKFEWLFTLRDGRVYDDDLPGSPEYAFYRITPRRAFGYGADGLTATRWRFRPRSR